ncbi:hypothetical protein GCM10007096_36780 [Pullulanibacillus pueri]|uniref:Alpha/beta hydrolase n=1 Tax=Pullulanibacillus pueri TaxID=1437324 RepID=A0A8J3ENQ0_9BACL|nr:alpha/beta hydrolase [Pullulanibacillus pueri]GGH87231.1 hypothetical protein GCM10007096_36780 [Pullulanibacillus pueri]
MLKLSQHQDWYPFHETGDVSKLQCPTLLMVGEDFAHETQGAMIYPKMNKHIHVAIIPFAGHLVHDEQPELYTSILEKFLSHISSRKTTSYLEVR